ncbi:2-dehydropantoate 2-reductase [Saccharopolyspora sp. NPDC002686]|uniref:2-dehydropantoate 2-reductase n=1 Tax=Saccharopolyspora sp. NPDC002686 TaxID=3154541 RepID=UPI0033215783
MTDAYTVVGGGAIGGTLAYSLAQAGHPVTIIDTDADHVAALRANGLTLDQQGTRTSVAVDAATPAEHAGSLRRVLLAVKTQATEEAMRWIAPRLADDGYVVSVQNGFNEGIIAEHVGWERTIAAFVNIFADVVEPGVIRDGGPGAFVIGEPGGAPISERVRDLVADLQEWRPATADVNIEGYLWAKGAFGAMLAATALADDAMADLIDRHRTAMLALSREVCGVAEALGIRVESFDAFDVKAFGPDADAATSEAAFDALTAWLRTQSKDRSGIWRDIAVRRRPTEVTAEYEDLFVEAAAKGLRTPVLRAVTAGLRELEIDPDGMSEARLDALDRLAAARNRPLPATPALTEDQARAVAGWLDQHRDAMVADLAAYTEHESPSDDPAALDACLDWLRGWLDESLGSCEGEERIRRDEAGDVLIRRYPGTEPGAAPVLLLCHYDTVWPLGTLAEIPFHRDGDRITGPGVFDMKAGLVQAVWALRALDALGLPRPACTVLLNGDEETGSVRSREAIIAEARTNRAAFVFEASAGGAVKTSRKGVGIFEVTVHGEEAHAGLDPTAGASAVHEMARQIVHLEGLRDLDAGTSVNVGVVHGGTRGNVTAGRAVAVIDVRVASAAERERITAAMAAIKPVDPRTSVLVEGGWNRPAFERTPEVGQLFELARQCARQMGTDLRETAVGGASDGNLVLDAGIPVLDGLGAVGAGAHARDEHATVSGMVERSALAAGVLAAFA